MKKKLFALIFALLMLVAVPVHSFAEFGNFAGDSDYGSDYDYDYDSGYDYDDDDYDYDYDYDDDYDDDVAVNAYYAYILSSHSDDDGFGGYYNYSGKSITIADLKTPDGEDKGNYNVIGAAILAGFIIIGVTVKKRKKTKVGKISKKTFSRPVAPGAERTDIASLNQMSGYTDVDPAFSETELKEKIANIYIQMQDCWQNKNLESLRPYLTDSLYAMYDRQLDSYRRNHETNYVERIAVLGTEFSGWKTDGNNDYIVATVKTRIVDYVVDDNSGNVIRGSKSDEKFMTYEWTLTRKTGVKTTVDSGTRVVICPQCGAPIDINKSAKCEYCDSVITVDSCDWVINEIRGISQRTGR